MQKLKWFTLKSTVFLWWWLKVHALLFVQIVDVFDDYQKDRAKCAAMWQKGKGMVIMTVAATFGVLSVFAPPLAIVYSFLLAIPFGIRLKNKQQKPLTKPTCNLLTKRKAARQRLAASRSGS